jgi:hypothetical protein
MYSFHLAPIGAQAESDGPVCRHCFNTCGVPADGSDRCDSCAALLAGADERTAARFMRPLSVIGIRADVVARFGDIEGALSEALNSLAGQERTALDGQIERGVVEVSVSE